MAIRAERYQPMRLYESLPQLKAVLEAFASGAFSPEEPGRYCGLADALLWGSDHDLLLADHEEYVATQLAVDALYSDHEAGARKAIANVAALGGFSSDCAIV